MLCPHCKVQISGPGSESLTVCPLCGKSLREAGEAAVGVYVGAGCLGLIVALFVGASVYEWVGGWAWLVGIAAYVVVALIVGGIGQFIYRKGK